MQGTEDLSALGKELEAQLQSWLTQLHPTWVIYRQAHPTTKRAQSTADLNLRSLSFLFNSLKVLHLSPFPTLPSPSRPPTP